MCVGVWGCSGGRGILPWGCKGVEGVRRSGIKRLLCLTIVRLSVEMATFTQHQCHGNTGWAPLCVLILYHCGRKGQKKKRTWWSPTGWAKSISLVFFLKKLSREWFQKSLHRFFQWQSFSGGVKRHWFPGLGQKSHSGIVLIIVITLAKQQSNRPAAVKRRHVNDKFSSYWLTCRCLFRSLCPKAAHTSHAAVAPK